MSEHPIQGLMKTAMESIKQMVDVNTIVGDAVQAEDGTIVIPISKVSFGFAAGGGEFGNACKTSTDQNESKFPFAGGSGAGVTISPVAFMVVARDNVRLMSVSPTTSVDKIIELVPDMVKKVNDLVKNKIDSKQAERELEEEERIEEENEDQD